MRAALLVSGLFFVSCGSSTSTCSDTDVSCQSVSDAALGDTCSSSDEMKWQVLEYDGKTVGARCRDGILGEEKRDRLYCSRLGYTAEVGSDESYIYCRGTSDKISLLYDQTFGAHKPWHCDTESSDSFSGTDSEGASVRFSCLDGILVMGSSTVDTGTYDKESGQPSSCSTSNTALFPSLTLEDFNPETETVETFKPDDVCKSPSSKTDSGTVTKPDDVSGASLRQRP